MDYICFLAFPLHPLVSPVHPLVSSELLRKFRSDLMILPLQLMNDRIFFISEQEVQKEGRFYKKEAPSMMEEVLEPGQPI